MKKGSPFTLQKVKQYSKAKYASESPKSLIRHALWLAWNFPNKMIKGAVTALLIVGLAVGLQACDDGDVDNDEILGAYPYCTPDYEYCIDNETAALCAGDGEFYTKDCNEFCLESIDDDIDGWLISSSCFEGKCECDYNEVAGVPAECSPGIEECLEVNGEFYISVCDHLDYGDDRSCDSICEGKYGNGYHAVGCDNEADEKCQCEKLPADGDLEVEVEIDGDLDTGEQEETEPDGDLDVSEQDKTELDGDLDTTEQETEISESDLG